MKNNSNQNKGKIVLFFPHAGNEENVGFKRAMQNKNGLAPIYFRKILGKKNKKKIKKNQTIKLANIKENI